MNKVKKLFWEFKQFLIRLNTDELKRKRRMLRSRTIKLILDDRDREEEFLERISLRSETQCVGDSLAKYLNDSLAKRAEKNRDCTNHHPVPRQYAIVESIIHL